jgi:hypothetical protein
MKVYVPVVAEFREDGTLIALEITWEGGRRFAIDKVTEIRQAAAMKVGGQGDRYTICVHGNNSYLYFERHTGLMGNNIGRWFVERKAE